MDRRRAVRSAKALGIDEPHAGRLALADDDKPALAGGAAQPLEFARIDRARGQFGDGDLDPEPALDTGGTRSRRIKHRHRRDPLAGDVEPGSERVEPVERNLLERGRDAERFGLGGEP